LPWLSARSCTDFPFGAGVNGRVPGDGVAPGPEVGRKVNSVIFCCDRLTVTYALNARPSLENNSRDSSIESTIPSN
jgi:hypothetical protein